LFCLFDESCGVAKSSYGRAVDIDCAEFLHNHYMPLAHCQFSRMMTVTFSPERCDKNPYCPAAKACPAGAMHIDPKTFRPDFDSEKCTGCESCIPSCPRGAMAAQG